MMETLNKSSLCRLVSGAVRHERPLLESEVLSF